MTWSLVARDSALWFDNSWSLWLSLTLLLIFIPWFLLSLLLSRKAFSWVRDNDNSLIAGSGFIDSFRDKGDPRDLNSKHSWLRVFIGSAFSCTSKSFPKVLFILFSNSFPPDEAMECLFQRFLSLLLYGDGQYTLRLNCTFFGSSPSPLVTSSWSGFSSLARVKALVASSWAFIAVSWQHKPYGGKTGVLSPLDLPSVEGEAEFNPKGAGVNCLCWLIPRFLEGKQDCGKENLLLFTFT